VCVLCPDGKFYFAYQNLVFGRWSIPYLSLTGGAAAAAALNDSSSDAQSSPSSLLSDIKAVGHRIAGIGRWFSLAPWLVLKDVLHFFVFKVG